MPSAIQPPRRRRRFPPAPGPDFDLLIGAPPASFAALPRSPCRSLGRLRHDAGGRDGAGGVAVTAAVAGVHVEADLYGLADGEVGAAAGGGLEDRGVAGDHHLDCAGRGLHGEGVAVDRGDVPLEPAAATVPAALAVLAVGLAGSVRAARATAEEAAASTAGADVAARQLA